jgi:hypothetical protein
MARLTELPTEILLEILILTGSRHGVVFEPRRDHIVCPPIVIWVRSFANRDQPEPRGDDNSKDLYHLATSCKLLYNVFHKNQYVVFSRICNRLLHPSLSRERVLKLAYLVIQTSAIAMEEVEESYQQAHDLIKKVLQAKVHESVQPALYGKMLRLVRSSQFMRTVLDSQSPWLDVENGDHIDTFR